MTTNDPVKQRDHNSINDVKRQKHDGALVADDTEGEYSNFRSIGDKIRTCGNIT